MTTYKKLLPNLITRNTIEGGVSYTHKKLIDQTMDRLKIQPLLKQKAAVGLKVENPRTSKFYRSPKIHKQSISGRGQS